RRSETWPEHSTIAGGSSRSSAGRSGGERTGFAPMNGKRCIVTGANSGIGEVMAREFARRGAEVVMVCRNVDKAEAVRRSIVDATGNRAVSLVRCDLSDLDSVNACAEELLSRDVGF